MKRILFAICFSALLSACVSAPRGAQKAALIAACPQGSSIIKSWSPGLFGPHTGEAHIVIFTSKAHMEGAGVRFCMPAETEISTTCKPINAHGGLLYCMPPGTPTFMVSVAGGHLAGGPLLPAWGSASELVVVPLQAGRMYEFRAHHKPEGYLITIVDVDVDSEKTVHEFILPEWTRANPNKPRDLTVPTQQ